MTSWVGMTSGGSIGLAAALLLAMPVAAQAAEPMQTPVPPAPESVLLPPILMPEVGTAPPAGSTSTPIALQPSRESVAVLTPKPVPASPPRPRTAQRLKAAAVSTRATASSRSVAPAPRFVPRPAPAASGRPAVVPPPSEASFGWFPLAFGALGFAVLVLLAMRYRRYAASAPARAKGEQEAFAEAASSRAYRTSGSWLTVTPRPIRAGLNLVTAVTDCEVTVSNGGAARAEAVRVSLTLLAAHGAQQAQIAHANAQPIIRPVAPVFTLGLVGIHKLVRM